MSAILTFTQVHTVKFHCEATWQADRSESIQQSFLWDKLIPFKKIITTAKKKKPRKYSTFLKTHTCYFTHFYQSNWKTQSLKKTHLMFQCSSATSAKFLQKAAYLKFWDSNKKFHDGFLHIFVSHMALSPTQPLNLTQWYNWHPNSGLCTMCCTY